MLRAVVEPLVEDVLGELQHALDSNASPRATLRALVERGLSDAKNAERSALWWHFVSLAAIAPECSQLLDEWYESVTRGIAQLIRAADPDYRPAESRHRATLLIASTKSAYTLSVALANFTGGSDGVIYNAISMVAFLAFMPVLVLLIAIQNHLSRGLTMGAVKG